MVSIKSKFKYAINSPRKTLARLVLGGKIWNELFYGHSCVSFKHAKSPTEILMTNGQGTTHEHYATFKILNHIYKIETILEIGVNTGESTIPFLESMINDNGFVTSIDIRPCSIAKQRVKELGYEKIWKFVQSDSLKVDWTDPIDHLYIDGLHTYDQVTSELKKYEPFVNKIITIHDLHLDEVRNAILDYIKDRKDLKYFEYYNCFGLGIILKSKKES